MLNLKWEDLHIYRVFLDLIYKRFFYFISFFSNEPGPLFIYYFHAFMFPNLFICFYLYYFLSPVFLWVCSFLKNLGLKASCVQVLFVCSSGFLTIKAFKVTEKPLRPVRTVPEVLIRGALFSLFSR